MTQFIQKSFQWMRVLPSIARGIDELSVVIHRSYENWNYDAGSNGERWILETLAARDLLDTVFDVGANCGDWAAMALEANPRAAVHCFEVCPLPYEKLSRRFSADERVRLNAAGLSDAEGDVEVNYCPANDEVTSMFAIQPPQTVRK